jgi:hypothetical protein
MIQENTTSVRSHADPMYKSKFQKPPSDDGGFFTCGNQTLEGNLDFQKCQFPKHNYDIRTQWVNFTHDYERKMAETHINAQLNRSKIKATQRSKDLCLRQSLP